MRRGVVRDIEETTRAITKAMADAERMAGVEVGAVYCGIAGRARGGAELPRHGVRHRRRDPDRRRGPGQRHGEQCLVRPRPRAAARDSAGLHHRPAARHQRADRHDAAPGSRPRSTSSPCCRACCRTCGKCGRAGRIQRRRVRAGAAGRVAGGADARRAGAGLRHRRAGRRLDQRLDLPGRQDPAHRLAPDAPAGTSPATWCTACR